MTCKIADHAIRGLVNQEAQNNCEAYLAGVQTFMLHEEVYANLAHGNKVTITFDDCHAHLPKEWATKLSAVLSGPIKSSSKIWAEQ